jgi:branched-chain amino acid transport system ATP-binding protein
VTTPALRCEGLDVAYGPVQVLFGVDLEVDPGEVVALLGTNGAGKSTLLRAVMGLTPPRRGRVELDGDDVTGADPAALARRGVTLMPGGRAVFPGLTVAENLRMATWLFRDDAAKAAAGIESVLELFPMLRARVEERAGLLSGGQQQMLALAQVLIGEPRLLLIDELSLGLAPIVVGELLGVVAGLKEQGVTIVLVEQSVNVAIELAERAVFMEKGEVRFEGPTEGLLERGDLLRSVFIEGGRAKARRPDSSAAPPGATGETALVATEVTKRFGGVTAVDAVDIDVRAGEIVGIIGANGAGKTTLLDLLSGFVTPDAGRVEFWGDDVTEWLPEERAEAGLGRSFQDARLFPGLTVTDNLAVAMERFTASREPVAAAFRLPAARVSELLVAQRVEELIGLLGLGAFRDKYAGELSTGSRRIVELASLIAQRADVVLLDEPSAGIAQKEAEALGPLLRRLRDATGAAIVIVEHDVPLLLATCDRLVAMELGRVIADGDPSAVVRDARVVASYLGADEAAVSRSGARRGRATRRRSRRVAST